MALRHWLLPMLIQFIISCGSSQLSRSEKSNLETDKKTSSEETSPEIIDDTADSTAVPATPISGSYVSTTIDKYDITAQEILSTIAINEELSPSSVVTWKFENSKIIDSEFFQIKNEGKSFSQVLFLGNAQVSVREVYNSTTVIISIKDGNSSKMISHTLSIK